MDRLGRALALGRARLATVREEPEVAVARLRRLVARRPTDVELRLRLAELELAAGHVERAVAEAGIAIQLAPTDLRGMSLLLQAQARQQTPAG